MRTPMTSLLRHQCLFIIFVILSPRPSAQQEEGPTVVIDPFRLSIEAGESQEVTCGISEGYESKVEGVQWLDPSGRDINELNASVSYTYSNGSAAAVMSIDGATVQDSGTYTCVVTLRDVTEQTNQTFWLNIYVMPTYMKEGMIVLGLNIGLGVVFGGLVIHTLVVDRRRAAKYGRISN